MHASNLMGGKKEKLTDDKKSYIKIVATGEKKDIANKGILLKRKVKKAKNSSWQKKCMKGNRLTDNAKSKE